MLPDWLFSSRVERMLREQQSRDQELIRWLRDRVGELQDKLAEEKSPGITARVEAPKRAAARERTLAEVVVEKKAREADFGDMPLYGGED